jgi:hypothetical protein
MKAGRKAVAPLPDWLCAHANGSSIRLHIQPNAAGNEVVGVQGDRLKVRVSAPPVDGKANRELVAYFAKALGAPKSSIEIVRGLSGRRKTLSVPLPPVAILEKIG